MAVAKTRLEDAQKKMVELTTGKFKDRATKLKTLQDAVATIKNSIEVLKRDNKFAYLQEVLSTQRNEAAIVAFGIAKEGCATFGG